MAYKFQIGDARLSGSVIQEGDILVSGSDPELALRDVGERKRFHVDYDSGEIRVRLVDNSGNTQVEIDEGDLSGSATVSGLMGDFESDVDSLGGYSIGATKIVTAARNIQNVGSVTATGVVSSSNDGRFLAVDVNGTEAISSARAGNLSSLNLNSGGLSNAGAVAGATTVSGSSNAQFGGTLASSHGKFAVDADGDVSAKSLNVRNGGISNAGAIAGVSTLSGSGKFESLELEVGNADDLFTVDALGQMEAVSGSITDLYVGDDLHVADDAIIQGGLNAASLQVDSVTLDSNIMAGLSQLTASEITASTIRATTGIFSANSIVVGSTTINETEIAMLDGLTLGSVAASKLVSADASKDVSGFRNVSGSGNLTFGGVLQAGLGGFGVDADGDTTVKSLNASNGGITNAGAIAGATTISGSGNLSGFAGDFESSVDALGGFAVGGSAVITGGKAIQNVTTISGSGALSGYSLNVDYGIDGGNGGITAAGAVSGVTTLSGSGNFQVGGSLSVANSGVNARDGYQVGGTGVIDSSRNIANAGNISGSGDVSGFGGDFEGAVSALGGFAVGGTSIVSAARAVSNVTSITMGGALGGATTISGSGELSGASLDVDGEVDAGSLEIGATEVISSARAVANITSITMTGSLSGATTISGSSNASFGGTLASSHGMFSVDADGDVSAKSLNVRNGGITNAGAISGASTISGSGELTGASLDVEGEVDAGSLEIGATEVITSARAVQNVTSVTMNGALAGATTVSGSSNASFGGTLASSHGKFSVDADGDLSAKSLNARSGGISNAGAIAGATTISGSGNLSAFAGDFESSVDALGGFAVGGSAIITGGKAIQNVTTISGSGALSGYSLNVDYGIDAGNGGISAAGAVAGVTTLSGSGNFQVGGSLSVANSGVNARDGYQVGGTGVIDSSRNIANAGNISGSGNVSGMAGDFESSVDALAGFAIGGTSIVAANRNLQNINAVATNLMPDANNTRNLGGATNKYAAVFATSLSGTNGEVDSMQVNNNLTVAGNLDVNGTVTTVDTVNLSIRDNFVLIASGANGSANNTNDQGFLFRRGSSDNDQAFIWDESADEFALIYDDSYDATATGNISFDGYSNLHVNSLVSENPITEGVQTVAVDATATVASAVVLAGSGSTLNMPASVSGYMYKLKNSDGGAGTKAITVNPNGSQKIDGSDSVLIESDYGAIFLVGDGSHWFIL